MEDLCGHCVVDFIKVEYGLKVIYDCCPSFCFGIGGRSYANCLASTALPCWGPR